MKSVKTAISIDSTTFRRVEQLTKKLHISRSLFFSQAARYMIEKDENLELLQKINAAHGNVLSNEEKKLSAKTRKYSSKKADCSW